MTERCVISFTDLHAIVQVGSEAAGYLRAMEESYNAKALSRRLDEVIKNLIEKYELEGAQ